MKDTCPAQKRRGLGSWRLALLIAGALAATACRTLFDEAAGVQPDADAADADEGGDGAGLGSDGIGATGHKGPLSGPKIMGYQYFARYSYGSMRGTYGDDQVNNADSRSNSMKNIKLKGVRYALETYPRAGQNQFGFGLLELRKETPDTDFWSQRNTAVVAAGFVLPKHRLIAPIIGLHMEFNRITLEKPDSPEVAKADVRAWLVGLRARQKIWGQGDWLAFHYAADFHLLNYTLASHGYEGEAGFGTALQFKMLRGDFDVSYLYQRYTAQKEAGDGDVGRLKVNSLYRATIFTGTFWL